MVTVQELQDKGLHIAQGRSRRNPTSSPFIYDSKNKTDIFNLEKTAPLFDKAAEAIAQVAASGRSLLLVGVKPEIESLVRRAGEQSGLPFVAGRWIGGTLTNFKQIRSRIDRLKKLREDRDTGARNEKYTKKECVLQDREIADLESKFTGIIDMENLPGIVFVIDPKAAYIAVAEAKAKKIPVVALANSDCNISDITYVMPGNDANQRPVAFALDLVTKIFAENYKRIVEAPKGVETMANTRG